MIVLTSSSDNIDVGFTWADLGLANLVTVSHSAPAGLTKVGESTDVDTATSMVRLSGFTHGGLYLVPAVATLDTGRTLERTLTIRTFYGAS
jgi:hypothetical protein